MKWGKFWLFLFSLGHLKFEETIPLEIYHEECIFSSSSRSENVGILYWLVSGLLKYYEQPTLSHLHCYSPSSFCCYNLPSLSCFCDFHKGLAALSLCASALLLMLIHKAAYVILRWERVRAWLRRNGNPCLTYGHKAKFFVYETQPVTVLTVVSASFATSKCCLHDTVSAGVESFLHVSGVQGQSASCSPLSGVATCFYFHGLSCFSVDYLSWVLIVSGCVKRSGSAKSIHRSIWVMRRPCACRNGSSFPLLRQNPFKWLV